MSDTTHPDGVDLDPAAVFGDVVGQAGAVDQLLSSAPNPVHAYMFVGPHGSGRAAAARGFAALVLRDGLDDIGAERTTRLALRGEHPDLVQIDPTGNTYRDEEVQRLIVEASRTPVEGKRKVIVADRFHTANGTVIGRLLKTLEEPPASTIIVLLNEDVPDEQITIASRCVTVDFGAVPHNEVVAWLQAQGFGDNAETVALASGGDLRRALDLSGDAKVVERHAAWGAIPGRLDGTGAAVAIVVEELRAMIDDAQLPIDERHVAEMAALVEREEQLGTRGSGRKDLEAAQKREVRRLRSDELRFGLATLAGVYRDRLVANATGASVDAIEAIRHTNEAIKFNPNEPLLLQSLLLALGNPRR